MNGTIAKLAREYAGYRMAVSNADDWHVIYHGTRVLDACSALALDFRTIENGLRNEIARASKRHYGECA